MALRYTIQQDDTRNDGASHSRTSRPKCYTLAEERKLLRHVRLNPKDTYAKLKHATRLACSTSTIKRILKTHGITNWRCKKRPHLTEKAVKARYKWCKKRVGWTAEE